MFHLKFRRACYVVILVALLPGHGLAQDIPEGVSEDPRVEWLEENVIPIRSIDPDDEDFRDLEPLGEALDGVRLVLLGEADHGSGSDFLAKTRLVKFLHQELGFDVLAFESPMYDMTVAWQELRAGRSAHESFWLGAGTWGGWAQMQPLAAYLGEHARGTQPLEIAGIDHQHQLASTFHFAEDFAGFLSQRGLAGPFLDPDSPEHGVLRGFVQALYQYGVTPRPDGVSVQRFMTAVGESLEAVSAMADPEARQWAKILRSLECQARFVVRDPEIGTCDRSEQMAKNLLWLVNERYPDRKVIAWSATLHAARLSRMSDFGVPDHWGGAEPSMGHRIHEAIGAESYVIGMTSYGGRSGRPEREIVEDQHPRPELEELMAAAGFDYGLLDLRHTPGKESWARGEFPARPHDHTTHSAVWSEALDAVLFIREQEPARPVEPPAADLEALRTLRDRQRAAYLGGDAEAYAAFFADDGIVMPPTGSPLRGRAAVRSWLDGVHQRFAVSGGDAEVLAEIVLGDQAWELYTAATSLVSLAGGETTDERVRGVRIYRRQPDGTWQIAQDTWNTTAAGGGTDRPRQ